MNGWADEYVMWNPQRINKMSKKPNYFPITFISQCSSFNIDLSSRPRSFSFSLKTKQIISHKADVLATNFSVFIPLSVFLFHLCRVILQEQNSRLVIAIV